MALSVREEEEPGFKAPANACDAHFHVFGSAARYPYGSDLRYAPPRAPLGDYLQLASRLGFERFVFVQPSAYGRDNACMLDAMREVGPRCRGIVDVDENVPDAELARLHAMGVRGVRINVSPVKPPQPGFGTTMLPRLRRLEARCAELGWQLDFLLPGWLTEELMDVLASLKVDFTLAHMGMFLAKDGPAQQGFRKLLSLVKTSRAYVKLTGVYRMSVAPGFRDSDAMAQALIDAAPERLIWGSDYPHLSFADKAGSVELFNLLGRWAPDPATRKRILLDNPERLFGFSR
jgi:predicted TIM-barrel fold metal-dependent hydrolase